MTLRLTAEFRRWSRWYPARWRRDTSAAMLGAYLDQAEGEGRDRLTWSEKAALAAGGVGARLDVVVPARVRDRAATAMVSLLGAFGLIAGILLEWAPGNPGPRLAGRIIPGPGIGLDFAPGAPEPRDFGPFVSPFVIVCALAIAAWVLSMVGPERLYRWALGLTAVAGVSAAATANQYSAVSSWHDDFGAPGAFVAVIALLALSAARPATAWTVGLGAFFWGSAMVWGLVSLSSNGFVQQYRGGMGTSALMLFQPTIWSMPVFTGPSIEVSGEAGGGSFVQFGVVPLMMLMIAVVLAAALALAAARRWTIAGALVLATLPWAAHLTWTLTESLAHEQGMAYARQRVVDYKMLGIDLGILLALYAAAVVVTVHLRRRAREVERIDDAATPVGQ